MISSLFASPAISAIASVIEKVIPDPNLKTQAMVQLAQMHEAGELAEIESQKDSNTLMELAHSRFIYLMIGVILLGLPIGLLSFIHEGFGDSVGNGMKDWLAALPDPMWDAFKVCFGITALPSAVSSLADIVTASKK